MSNFISLLVYVFSGGVLFKVALKLSETHSRHMDSLEDDEVLEYIGSLLPLHAKGQVVGVDELFDVYITPEEEVAPTTEPLLEARCQLGLKEPEGFDTYHLDEEQRRIAEVILKSAGAEDSGGCRAFYTPEEWQDRGEDYGCDSVLIVVHDGGDLARAFNISYGDDETMGAVYEALKAAGFWSEACTCWYTAIYRDGE